MTSVNAAPTHTVKYRRSVRTRPVYLTRVLGGFSTTVQAQAWVVALLATQLPLYHRPTMRRYIVRTFRRRYDAHNSSKYFSNSFLTLTESNFRFRSGNAVNWNNDSSPWSSHKQHKHCAREKGGGVNIKAGGKYSNCQADLSAPSDAKIKNEWRYISTPPSCLYGIQRDIFQWLANFSEKPPSSEAGSSSASQEILRVLRKPKVQYRV